MGNFPNLSMLLGLLDIMSYGLTWVFGFGGKLTRNGINQRKSTWQDGVLGTNCPIPPNTNWTYKFQTKDQIGTFTYFPSTQLHKAAGGFGGFNIAQRSVISIPYPRPDGEFTLLVGDWYKANHKVCIYIYIHHI
jgi:hypothetical protein